MSLRGVGIDIVEVARIARLIRMRGEAFTGRWFTVEEVADCSAADRPEAAFAARLAAKEAVWKSLGLDGNRPVPWRSITIGSDKGTEFVVLHDDVATAGEAVGVQKVSVSTTSLGDLAMAVAMAWCTAGRVVARPTVAEGLGFRHE